MPVDHDKAEAELRSRIYAALVEITLAPREEKEGFAQHLKDARLQLHDLIVYGMAPEL